MNLGLTIGDLVQAVAEHAESEAEVAAAVAYLVNSGKVRLCGVFAGARFDLGIPLGPRRMPTLGPLCAARHADHLLAPRPGRSGS